MKKNQQAKRARAFSLVEVLTLLFVLAAITATVYMVVRPTQTFNLANNARRLADTRNIHDAIINYSQERESGGLSFLTGVNDCSQVPYTKIGTSGVDLANLAGVNLVSLGYLTKVPLDPKIGTTSATGYSICKLHQNDVLVKADQADGVNTIVNNFEGIIVATITMTPAATPTGPTATPNPPTPTRTGTPTMTLTPTPDPSNVAFYKFEEGAGNTIVSATYPSTSNLAIITPASPYPSTHTWVPGRPGSGNALRFTPVAGVPSQNTLIELSSPTLHGITGNMTVMAWVKPANYNQPYTIVDASGPGESAQTNRNFELKLTTGPTLLFAWEFGNGSDLTVLPPQTLPAAGTWYHVAVTRNLSGPTGVVVFYINGTGYTVAGGNSGNYPNNNNNASMKFGIGKASDDNNEFYNGEIDSIRVFNRVLNSTEVNYYMNVN